MIDIDKYEGHISGPWELGRYFSGWKIYWFDKDFCHDVGVIASTEANARLMADAPLLLAEVKRLQKENKILAKYMDIVNKYDDALLADGDTDPRWSELYD